MTHPDVTDDVHPTKNDKTVFDYTYGSHTEVWWHCPKYQSHVWRARIASRTVMLAGYPACARVAGKGVGPKKAQRALDPTASAVTPEPKRRKTRSDAGTSSRAS